MAKLLLLFIVVPMIELALLIKLGSLIGILDTILLIVFTGTAGERSSILRRRIISHLEFADFILDGKANDACTNPVKLTKISQDTASKPIVVIPTDEELVFTEDVVAILEETYADHMHFNYTFASASFQRK